MEQLDACHLTEPFPDCCPSTLISVVLVASRPARPRAKALAQTAVAGLDCSPPHPLSSPKRPSLAPQSVAFPPTFVSGSIYSVFSRPLLLGMCAYTQNMCTQTSDPRFPLHFIIRICSIGMDRCDIFRKFCRVISCGSGFRIKTGILLLGFRRSCSPCDRGD